MLSGDMLKENRSGCMEFDCYAEGAPIDENFALLTPRNILQLASRLTRRHEAIENPIPSEIPAWVSRWQILWALSLGSMQFRGSLIGNCSAGLFFYCS